MLLTPDSYRTDCSCNPPHEVFLRRVFIQPGALFSFDEQARAAGLPTEYCTVYDENTYEATAGRRPRASREIILKAGGLHADERGVEALQSQLGPTPMLVAVGSGTVHDLTRYCAARAGLAMASVPTAASMDGFASYSSSMTLRGMKVTVPAISPTLIVADNDIFAKAPWRLTCSGAGDILGKYIALSDWKLSHLLTGEDYCPGVEALTRRAVEDLVACCPQLKAGDSGAYGKLMEALVLSGVAMQLVRISRPAAGAEHYVSHTLEAGLPWLGRNEALHGEKVGVATLLCARDYHSWAALTQDEVAAALHSFTPPAGEEAKALFGKLLSAVEKENEKDSLKLFSTEALIEGWPAIQDFVAQIPPADEIRRLMLSLGAKTTLEEIGVAPALEGKLMRWAPYIRNRLTLERIGQYLIT